MNTSDHKRHFKSRVYTELSRITKALANPHRLEILELLAQGEFSVEGIATNAQLSIANTSQHLQVLNAAELVTSRRQGNLRLYQLSDSQVFKAWKGLRDLGVERLSTIDKVIKGFRLNSAHDTLSIDELMERLHDGMTTVIDVRPNSEFRQGHIAGALSLPLKNLNRRMKELPPKNEIVAYCRGPFCVYADEAVDRLIRLGYRARRLEEGFPEWKLRGLPVEVSMN